jgi:beta-lactamase regulating signal transducer with metallopeptidase domain
MDSLVHLGLLNAMLALLLALLAAAARYVRCRPPLVHALWLLVLLKLITPPFIAVPIAWLPCPDPDSAPPAAKAQPVAEQPNEAPISALPEAPVVVVPRRSSEEGVRPDATAMPGGPGASPSVEPAAGPTNLPVADEANAPALPSQGQPWERMVGAAWLAGAVSWWSLAALRLIRFRMSLRSAALASLAVQERAERLARRMGLRHCPRVYVLPAPITPLLWAVAGTPCLLLPAILWGRLSREQQETLLAHELAHLRRGDPWVRRLELVVLGLYWWHPVVWWARHEIQEAEEACCDAWVLWAIPSAAETYATALLETVAFLSRLRPALPVGASGAGHTHSLRRRLTMILKGTTPRALSRTALAALLVCAAALLPLRPTWGQDRPATPAENTTPVVQTPATDTVVLTQQAASSSGTKISGPAVNSDTGLTGSIAVPRDVEEAKDLVELVQAQLESKKAELLEARALVEQSNRQLGRLNKLRERGTVAEEEVEQARTELDVREARLQAKSAQVKEAEVRLRQANRWLSRVQSGAQHSDRTGTTSSVGTAPAHSPSSAANRAATGGTTNKPGIGSAPDHAARNQDLPDSSTRQHKIVDRAVTPDGGDQRMRDLEMKLDKLIKEVDALRQQIRRQQPGGTGGSTNNNAVPTPATAR